MNNDMTKTTPAPETRELAEETLEKVSGGEGLVHVYLNEPDVYKSTFEHTPVKSQKIT